MIELAMPAGTLREALEAFRGGADAVYFGLKDFSARKGAGNFSEEDFSKIRRYALSNGKKLYITLNTLLSDEELPRAFDYLKMIESYGIDGLIVQDLGVARLVRDHFPSIPLHASTQLAVHTKGGIRALQRLGFTRMVLSRELSLSEIRELRAECPDVELKVFIHGALCYGFSGLCMASSIITGRSANRGECAQVCRTWFTDEKTGRKLYPFSLEDLDAGTLVRELMDIGIDSLKVEGRLKGPEYVRAVSQYYRAIIDGRDERPYKHAVACSFQRKCGHGFLERSASPMTTGLYTGHRGEHIGKVLGQRGRELFLSLDAEVKAHDGILIIKDGFSYKFPARSGRSGALILPESVTIPEDADVYRISDSSLNLKEPGLNLPLMRKPVPADVTLSEGELRISTKRLTRSYPVRTEPAQSSPEEALQKIFSQAGGSPYVLKPAVTSGKLYTERSRLKAIRNEYLEELSALTADERKYSVSLPMGIESLALPDRWKLDGERTPWNTEGVRIDGKTWFSFPAVRFDEDRVFREMEERAGKAERPIIGLNNIGDLEFALRHPEFSYFADIYFYIANREAAALLVETLPGLKGAYLQLERKSHEEPWPFKPSPTGGYAPPLFISRACYRHDGLGLGCGQCGKHHTYHIRQNGKRYEVLVDNCMTVVRP